MHTHQCRSCHEYFHCADELECFQTLITCDDCFRERDLPKILICFALASLIVCFIKLALY